MKTPPPNHKPPWESRKAEDHLPPWKSRNKPEDQAWMRDLPPWKSRKPDDQQWLIDWTNAMLDMDKERAIADAFIRFGDGGPPFPPPDWVPDIKWAEEVYEDTGDNSLLLKINPKLAKAYPRKRGAPIKEQYGVKFWEAAWDYKSIMQIWQEHYGNKNRSENDPVTAKGIAADRNGIIEDREIDRLDSCIKKL